jgi:prepilin-type N-terminal cleavage/methylation domain-containing protein
MPRSGRTARAGFTLIEILIVLALMTLLAGIFLPGIGGVLPFEIRSASRVLSAELGYASQRAVATGEPHRWVVDLDAQRFRLEYLHEEPPPEAAELPTHAELLDLRPPRAAREFRPIEEKVGEWRRLDQSDVRIARVQIGDEEHDSGVVAVGFAPDGGSDPAEIRLEDGGGYRFRLRLIAFTGEVRVEEEPGA